MAWLVDGDETHVSTTREGSEVFVEGTVLYRILIRPIVSWQTRHSPVGWFVAICLYASKHGRSLYPREVPVAYPPIF